MPDTPTIERPPENPSRRPEAGPSAPSRPTTHDGGEGILRREAPSAKRSSWASYKTFWADVGDNFPDLGPARSTEFYRRDEQRLFLDYLPDMTGLRVMKTDLWDEAKNTRILRWAAKQGVEAYGVDISPPIVADARRNFGDLKLRAPVSDCRWLPFREGSFDAIYSMGTIEHFLESEEAVREMFRVLRPGGRVILGVPNRWDPFLRPLMVAVMYRLGLYDYGYEKSFSKKALRRMMEAEGFFVTDESGILFIPGWLRILDLVCNTWARPLRGLTGSASAFFAWLARKFPVLHRHGYLIASVGVKPEPDGR